MVLFAIGSAQADRRYSGADGLEQAYEMLQQIREAQYELLTLWIDCELDNLCVCDNKQALYQSTKNFALKVMIESEREQDLLRCERMREDVQYCRVPLIQEVNKALIPCYVKFRDGLFFNDAQMYESGGICIAEQLQPMLAQNNPYAVYVYVDYLTANRDKYPGLLAYYEQQLEALKGTQDYKVVQQCYDFVVN